jgi:cytochrome c-type biogenesis protein CcmH/NrfG
MEFSAPWYVIVELGMLSVSSMKIGKAAASSNTTWPPWQVYVMATICLLIGLAVGYLVRGSVPSAPSAAVSGQPSRNSAPQQMPTLQDMKRMADKQVEPLLEKLKAEPNNSDLLNQVGTIYRMTHQFETAASYYQEALQINPENVGARTDLASCLYYQGDVDGAIAQLEKSLAYDPGHAGTLLNLGIIRWKGKSDAAGAIAAWNKLLKYNPDYQNKQMVEKFIADAKAHSGKPLPLTD